MTVLCHPKISNCLSQHHSHCCLILVACFVTATYTLVLSCALLCLSITLLLLSRVPCFVSASCCSLLSHVLCFVSVVSVSRRSCALSQHAITPLFSALPCPGYSIMSIAPRSTADHTLIRNQKLSIELEFNGCITMFLLSHVSCFVSASCLLLALSALSN